MAKQSKYKVFDGNDWVDPCTTEIRLLKSLTTTNGASVPSFELLDPEVRVIKYYDGSQWVRMRCIEPECFCPEGYTKNPVTNICEASTPALFDGTLAVIGQGGQIASYGQRGLLLYDTQTFSTSSGITLNSYTQFYFNGVINPVIPDQTFKADLWTKRLQDCGVAQYKYPAWNRKIAYAIGDVVLYYDPTTAAFKKHTAINNIAANNTPPFNSSPINDTVNWTAGATLTYDVDINKFNQTSYEFKYCLNLTENKIYHVGLSGDNACFVSLQLNSSGSFYPVVSTNHTGGLDYNFERWYVIPITLPAGNHILKLKGYNNSGEVSTGIEIYDMNKDNDPNINPVEKFKQEFIYGQGTTSIEPLSHTTDTYAKLEPYILFSTSTMVNKSVPIPNEVDPGTGQPYVPYCGDGTTLDFCNGAPLCTITTPCLDEPPI